MENNTLEVNTSYRSSQEELNAYRSIGSVSHFNRLRREEIKRRKRAKLISKVLGICWIALGGSAFVWILASWLDIIAHNHESNPVFKVWNFFTLLF